LWSILGKAIGKKRIMRKNPGKKPRFLTRLGNIIIIQVLFVFAALAIVIFYPHNEYSVDAEYIYMREKLRQAGDQVSAFLDDSLTVNDRAVGEQSVFERLSRALDIDNVVQGYVYVWDDLPGPRKMFALKDPHHLKSPDEWEEGFDQLVDQKIIEHQMHLDEDLVIPIIHGSRYFVYYYRLTPRDFPPMVVVVISDHASGLPSYSQIRYPFLILFLASALVSLLTVYLINKRFREPLERLITGFERTVRGELYSLVETDMDDELSKLSKAYNNMSLALWENHKQLKDYNARLEEANEMLAESEDFLGTLIDSSPTCIISASPDGERMLFNRKAADVFGVERASMIGRNIDELFTHRLNEIKTSRAIVGDTHSLEVLCRRGDGSLFPAYLITAPVNTASGDVWAYLYMVKDISESKRFQEMMIRLDRYYTRGEMAGDIAHEINNFLAILSGNLELMPLLMKKGDRAKIDQKLDVMKGAVDRITRFTDGLLDSHEDEVRFEITDINQLVETVVAFLKPQNRFDVIDIQTNLSTDIPLVELDSGQIQQLLVNLLHNASEALQGKTGEKRIIIRTGLQADADSRRITVTVHDNGPGVEPGRENKLFAKRFTTKRRGQGIGLTTCKRIVDTHGGTISYSYDEGAVFHIELPAKREPAAPQASPQSETAAITTA